MKGIILAGGNGSRLYPVTSSVSKQLLPVYDKPMIFYPLSVLMLSDIREILIITNAEYIDSFKNLLGNGNQFGINIDYCAQDEPNGIAEAFILGEEFIENDNVCLILGDNIFYGQDFTSKLVQASKLKDGAIIFSYHVDDPENFGVIEFDKDNNVISIEEKPKKAKSNFAITGIYFYDNNVISIAKNLSPSSRGELEITDINKHYLSQNKLKVENLGRGFAWLDTGNHRSLLDAGIFVRTVEERQGLKIACLEEIAYKKNWIDEDKLNSSIKYYNNTNYEKYLKELINKVF